MREIIDAICARISGCADARILICIDGPAGAGKTTLAAALATELIDVAVVHMDELYDGWDGALSADLTRRLVTQIRDPFLAGRPVRYEPYDWYAFSFGASRSVAPTRALIVEGVGSAQQRMRERAHVTVFIDIAPALGRERVITRDGDVVLGHIEAWQAAESAHFSADETRRHAHIIVNADQAL